MAPMIQMRIPSETNNGMHEQEDVWTGNHRERIYDELEQPQNR